MTSRPTPRSLMSIARMIASHVAGSISGSLSTTYGEHPLGHSQVYGFAEADIAFPQGGARVRLHIRALDDGSVVWGLKQSAAGGDRTLAPHKIDTPLRTEFTADGMRRHPNVHDGHRLLDVKQVKSLDASVRSTDQMILTALPDLVREEVNRHNGKAMMSGVERTIVERIRQGFEELGLPGIAAPSSDINKTIVGKEVDGVGHPTHSLKVEVNGIPVWIAPRYYPDGSGGLQFWSTPELTGPLLLERRFGFSFYGFQPQDFRDDALLDLCRRIADTLLTLAPAAQAGDGRDEPQDEVGSADADESPSP